MHIYKLANSSKWTTGPATHLENPFMRTCQRPTSEAISFYDIEISTVFRLHTGRTTISKHLE